jgi:hypothetical protein
MQVKPDSEQQKEGGVKKLEEVPPEAKKEGSGERERERKKRRVAVATRRGQRGKRKAE